MDDAQAEPKPKMTATEISERQYANDQSIASIVAAAERLRLNWAKITTKVLYENGETDKAKEALDGEFLALDSVVKASRELLDTFLDDVAAERAAAAIAAAREQDAA